MSCSYTLASVVAEICDRAGLPFGKYDVTLLDGEVWGMQISNESPAYEHIQKLAQAYFFDPSNRGDLLSFVHRGAEPVLNVSEDDLIGDSADETVRKSPEEIVQVLNLNYYDSEGGIDTDKQTSDRSIDTRGEGEESIDTDLVLETDYAARQVVVAHKVMIEEQRGDLDISLPDNYLALTPGDVVTFRNDRYRITEVNVDDGEQKYKMVFDRQSAYSSTVFGVAPVPPPEPVSHVPGPTILQFMDVHILADGDDTQLGFYMAISGQSEAWRGATIEMSIDGGEAYIDSRTRSAEAIMGELVTPLASARREVPDAHNTCQVRIDTTGVALESRTLADMLNRQNRALIGDEIVNFGSVQEVSPGVWEIDYFLRGRLGSEIPASHAAGTRFVMLTRNFIEYVPTEIFNLGQPLTFRATSTGSDTETIITETFNGISQLETAPGYLRARRDGGNIIIDWIGTGRLGGRGSIQNGQFFTGYRVDVNGSITDTANQNLTVSDPGGSVTITVVQLNSFTGEGQPASITI